MKRGCLAVLLGIAACSGSLPDDELGAAVDPLVAAYAIAGVQRSPISVHFAGLPWLLNSAEATGPMVLTVHVGNFVLPTMTTTVSGVAPDVVSRAVGYSLSERHDLYAVSSATLEAFRSSRLEAYSSFEETSWEVVDLASGAFLGTGSSFNPSGVFFQTVPALHVALPDMGLFTFVPGCEDLECLPLPGPGGSADAGATGRGAPGFLPTSRSPVFSAGGGEGAASEPSQ